MILNLDAEEDLKNHRRTGYRDVSSRLSNRIGYAPHTMQTD
jgi:hypothetical protein